MFAMSVALATDVKVKDQFQIDMSKAKHNPPNTRKKNVFLSQIIFEELFLSSNFIQAYKKGNAKRDL